MSTDRAAVLPLQIDDVDVAPARELSDELVRPVGVRVELEAKVGIEREPLGNECGSRRARERDRTVLAPERVAERPTRVAERQVERRRLEPPAPVVEIRVLVGRAGRKEVRPSRCAESESSVQSPARSRLRGAVLRVLVGRVGDVLADPLGAAADEMDHGGLSSELG